MKKYSLKEVPLRYSLALGGGAARGFAHIGVLKYLEEKNIEIEEISGTSMGALIGAFIAIGKSSEEIKNFAKSVNFLKLVDFDLKTGLLKGDKIEKLLEKIFGDTKIEETKIPLKIVATNIETSESMVFTSGRIVDAIRASVSLPGIFMPKIIENNSYVDGGIMMNLPIETLTGKNIIAISALKINSGEIVKEKKFLGINFKTGFCKNNYEIIKRSVVLMMSVNEKNSLKNTDKNIKFIRPDFGELDIMHFNKIDEFFEIGDRDARKLDL